MVTPLHQMAILAIKTPRLGMKLHKQAASNSSKMCVCVLKQKTAVISYTENREPICDNDCSCGLNKFNEKKSTSDNCR